MEQQNIYQGNKVINSLLEKCPKCGKGKMFEQGARLFQIPPMKEKCELCGYKFDREPGYFLGAMYISYGLAVFQGIITFLICYFMFPNLATIWTPVFIMLVIIIMAPKNYRLARSIYVHIFPW